jgi:hypothetical protein
MLMVCCLYRGSRNRLLLSVGNIKMHDWQTDTLLKYLTQLIVAVTSVLLKLSRTPPLGLIISINLFFLMKNMFFRKWTKNPEMEIRFFMTYFVVIFIHVF